MPNGRFYDVFKLVNLHSILQVKIQGQNQEMLYAACQQFLGKSPEEVRSVALETLV